MKKLKPLLFCITLAFLAAACASGPQVATVTEREAVTRPGIATEPVTAEQSEIIIEPEITIEPGTTPERVIIIEPEPAVNVQITPDQFTFTDNFIFIEGGTFLMGSPVSEVRRFDNEGPQRQVTVNSFYMGMYEVTQKEYEEIMGVNPSRFRGDDLPVECVSWLDAIEYCNRRSIREGLTPAYIIIGSNIVWDREANGYRLPTEAEWEYACRAGTTGDFNTGSGITSSQANFDNNTGRTTPAGSFAPNAWGLYDMHGNVWEWCWDLFGSYPNTAQTNPSGPVSGTDRVLRGGGWSNSVRHIRSACRVNAASSYWANGIGFRLVRP